MTSDAIGLGVLAFLIGLGVLAFIVAVLDGTIALPGPSARELRTRIRATTRAITAAVSRTLHRRRYRSDQILNASLAD